MAERVLVCVRCGAEYIATTPRSKYCSRICRKIAQRWNNNKWYADHREDVLVKRRQWYADNLERAHEWAHRYYYNHRDACLERTKRWRDANRDEYNARQRAARAAYRAEHGYPVRTCRRCGVGFKPLYGAQQMCEACMTKRSPTWRRKLKFLLPKPIQQCTTSPQLQQQTTVVVKQLTPDERGMLYCPRLRLKATELPCGEHMVCFGTNRCEFCPEDAQLKPRNWIE